MRGRWASGTTTSPRFEVDHSPDAIATDGEAANPGPRHRRRGPRSLEGAQRRTARWLRHSQGPGTMEDCFAGDERITVVHLNVRGWLTNNHQLYAQLCLLEHMPEIIVVNESKLNPSVKHPALPGYVLVARKDNKEKQHGGGVLVFAASGLSSQVTYMDESKYAERVWVMLHTTQGPYLLGAWYRSPSPSVDVSITSLQEELEKQQRSAVGTMLIGDLNLHHTS